jgi:hypothetical protein
MQRHAHAQRPDLTPIFAKQRPLGIEGGSDGIRSGAKRRLHRIADSFEVDAAMRLDGRIKQSDMSGHRSRHHRGVTLPERGAPLDIREEKSDGAGGEIGHDPLQMLGWT